MSSKHRPEQDVFDELAGLCLSPGFAHAIALLTVRDNYVPIEDELTADGMAHMFTRERLIRSEINALVGLMLKGPVDYSQPDHETLLRYMQRAEELLEEIHRGMEAVTWASAFDPTKGPDDKWGGAAMREPVFYCTESAYRCQYEDFSVRKYRADNDWLLKNCGFKIEDVQAVMRAVSEHTERHIPQTYADMEFVEPAKRTILPGFTFSEQDIQAKAGIPLDTVKSVLRAFSVPPAERNVEFRTISDFNVITSTPFLLMPDGRYLAFHPLNHAEALYESPYYWMLKDKPYWPTLSKNRGDFAETLSEELLAKVFGNGRVFRNVKFKKKGTKVDIGEIDVLVLFGDRAIVLQAKTKKMTIAAKKGSDLFIQKDFGESVQDACDQAFSCGSSLLDRDMEFFDSSGQPLQIPALKLIYPLCIVTDHYPALSFQTRQYMKYQSTNGIAPPFVLDVFALDAMTEMLQTPLRLLSYIDRRAKYIEVVIAHHELTVLSYHLKQNLYFDPKVDSVMLEDDISTDLDIAMAARRDGVPGKKTPTGILTKMLGTRVMHIVEQIESRPDPDTIELGFQLLMLGEDSFGQLGDIIGQLSDAAMADGGHHDCFMSFGKEGMGLTVHVNNDPIDVATERLRRMCTKRKYEREAAGWYGMCIFPAGNRLRFGMVLEYPWVFDAKMHEATKNMPSLGKLPVGPVVHSQRPAGSRARPGRNEPCYCGSSKKYKKCCLPKDEEANR